MVHGLEGFLVEGFTARTDCKTALAKCQAGCTNASCFQGCMTTNTACLAKATAAESVAVTNNLQRTSVAVNNSSPMKVGGSVVPNYSQYLAAAPVWNGTYSYASSSPSSPSASPSPSSSPSASASPSSSPSASASPSPSSKTPSVTPSSPWDANKTPYTSGWPQASPATQDDDSYDANIPLEGSYTVSIKKWKPHETPVAEPAGLKINAPTDAGTQASTIVSSAPHAPSLQQLIRDDVDVTMEGIFSSPYEIQYQ